MAIRRESTTVTEWEDVWKTEAYYDNSGNGSYHEWVEIKGTTNLVELFDRYLEVYHNTVPVIVRARGGMVQIEVDKAGGKG